MPINFDRAFGIHQRALALRAYRSGVLASNVANADTPHYKARDFDFKAALAATTDGSLAPRLTLTHTRHLRAVDGPAATFETAYRIPLQPAVDGNTVDTQMEQAAFMDNALRYQASINFLSGRIRGLLTAIRGE